MKRIAFALLLIGCGEQLPDGTALETGGTWYALRPPPNAPEGTVCYLFKAGLGDHAWGGPECFIPKD